MLNVPQVTLIKRGPMFCLFFFLSFSASHGCIGHWSKRDRTLYRSQIFDVEPISLRGIVFGLRCILYHTQESHLGLIRVSLSPSSSPSSSSKYFAMMVGLGKMSPDSAFVGFCFSDSPGGWGGRGREGEERPGHREKTVFHDNILESPCLLAFVEEISESLIPDTPDCTCAMCMCVCVWGGGCVCVYAAFLYLTCLGLLTRNATACHQTQKLQILDWSIVK